MCVYIYICIERERYNNSILVNSNMFKQRNIKPMKDLNIKAPVHYSTLKCFDFVFRRLRSFRHALQQASRSQRLGDFGIS